MMRRFVPRVAVSQARFVGRAQQALRYARPSLRPPVTASSPGFPSRRVSRVKLRDHDAEQKKASEERKQRQQRVDAVSLVVAATRTKLDRLYRDNFKAVQARVGKAHRDHILIVDLRAVSLRDFDSPPHTFFADAITANEAALDSEDGSSDGCTAALSLPFTVAAQLRDEVRRVVGASNVECVRVAAGGACGTVVEHFKGRDVGPIVERFPALKYLALKAVLDGSGPVVPGFKKLLKEPGVRAHCEHLVGYGEGVLRWLVRKVPPTAADLDPDFRHTLTRDLQVETGLRRTYSPEVQEELESLRGSVRCYTGRKETNPVRVIASAPRMGKSLALQDVARSAEKGGRTAVCVAYSSVGAREMQSIRRATAAFYFRLLMACAVPAAAQHPDVLAVTPPARLDSTECYHVLQNIGLKMPEVICVDDIAKIVDGLNATMDDGEKRFAKAEIENFMISVLELCGGSRMYFTYNATHVGCVPFLIFHWSGRGVSYWFLDPPTLPAKDYEAFRVRISPLRTAMADGCPLLFRACQFIPGLLGHLLNNATRQKTGTGAEPLLSSDYHAMLHKQRGDKAAHEALRHLVCSELCGSRVVAEYHVEAQKAGLGEPLPTPSPWSLSSVCSLVTSQLSPTTSNCAEIRRLPASRTSRRGN